ncbi:50S ribosomal protein L10 ['Camptotheca acuminata' phytoplasma]|uniref:50S ribosomal protein L10 n=1 Tax='Camptotheca acuminata' phytoplasma TaxID=3239192 RepID=UPI00351A5E54
MVNKNVIDKKSQEVDLLIQNIKSSELIILFEYQGLTVSDLTELRVELKKNNSTIKLYPNNILKRAFKTVNYNELADLSKNAKALLLCSKDSINSMKILDEFSKKFDFLKIVVGVLENKVCSKKDISELSLYSSKESLLASLASMMLASLRELTMGLNVLQKQK